MATDVATADAEKKPAADSRPKAVEDKHDGAGAASTMPAVQRCPGASLGERQVQAQAAPGNTRVGGADDAAENKADMAADHVMRQMDTPPAAAPVTNPSASPGTPSADASASPAPASPTPESAPTTTPAEPVRRTEDPAAEQRLPGAEPAKPATPAASAAPGAGPQTATSAGPAPLIAPPDAAGARPAETGMPAPDAEPPAPEGEAPARETPQVPDDVQEYLDASRGKGAPLPDATLRLFEDKFQRPFDDVRIHDDAGADDAARKIDALAFTRGNDIYFRSGAYDPTSQQGKKLLAHELAHVVQQRPGINRKAAPGLGGAVIRRASTTAGGGSRPSVTLPEDLTPAEQKDKKYKGLSGTLNTQDKSLVLGEVHVPAFKFDDHSAKAPLKWNPAERTDAYRAIWADNAREKIAPLVPAKAQQEIVPGPPFYFQRTNEILVFGTAEDIGNALSTIPWENQPNFKKHPYQIDHKQEHQLGGLDEIDNLQLLDASTNRASGPAIEKSIENDIKAIMGVAAAKQLGSPPESVETVKTTYNLTFSKAAAGPNPRMNVKSDVWKKNELEPKDFWTLNDLGKASAIAPLQKMNGENQAKVEGSAKDKKLAIVTRLGGGRSGVQSLSYTPESGHIDVSRLFLKGAFEVASGTYKNLDKPAQPDENVGSLVVRFFPDNPNMKPVDRPFDIVGVSGVNYGGLVDTKAIRELGKGLKKSSDEELSHKKASPLELLTADFDFEKGLVGRAKIPKPSISVLENVELGVVIDGKDVGIEATISGGQLKLPGPFKVTGGSLTLSVTTGGFGVDGEVDFEIEKLAKGYVRAAASSKGASGFALEAELNFDTKMFDRGAQVRGSYKDGDWALEGKLGVGPKAIKGIKEASVHVQVTKDAVTADGEFETSLKGVEKGTIGFRYNEATGMEITGEIILGKGIPGIKSGKLDATIKEGPDGHSLSGGVTLEPSVPGLTGTVTGHYEDGAFFVQADLGYEKGLAKGKVNIGLTNQAVGEDGKPAGPPKPDGSITAFGTGLVKLTLTPWLTGTVGLTLTPTGEIEVSGEVELPPTFEVFGKLPPLEKEIFSVHIDIPIVGVSVAGVHVGIFATVGGGASISAGVGPGVLRDVALKVTYNPDRPDDTTVTGTGSFAVPAHASLRLTVGGGLGVGIPLVDATAELNAHGEIGVAGEASAGVQVAWAPATGIVLDARGDIFVEPKFKFGVDACVEVTVGFWRLKKTLYEHKWCLASFEFGSNLRFGLSLPIHYESLKPFDISFDQIQWTYPQIEPKELLSNLMEQLVSGPAQTPEC
jgi:hypothetical protein